MRDQLLQHLHDPLRRLLPGKIALYPLGAPLPQFPGPFRLLDDLAQITFQGFPVRFEQPGRTGSLLRIANLAPEGRDHVSVFTAAEVVAGPARRDDYRQATGHRLGHGQAESLAAVRMHQTVAGRVQSGDLGAGQILGEIYDLRTGRIFPQFADQLPGVVAAVKRLHAHVLDHQADIVARGETGPIRLQQHVDSLAEQGAAHK